MFTVSSVRVSRLYSVTYQFLGAKCLTVHLKGGRYAEMLVLSVKSFETGWFLRSDDQPS